MSHEGGGQCVTWMRSVCPMEEKVMCHMEEEVNVSHR